MTTPRALLRWVLSGVLFLALGAGSYALTGGMVQRTRDPQTQQPTTPGTRPITVDRPASGPVAQVSSRRSAELATAVGALTRSSSAPQPLDVPVLMDLERAMLTSDEARTLRQAVREQVFKRARSCLPVDNDAWSQFDVTLSVRADRRQVVVDGPRISMVQGAPVNEACLAQQLARFELTPAASFPAAFNGDTAVRVEWSGPSCGRGGG